MAARIGDARLSSIITDGDDGDIVLIGFPFDEGCTRNGGRPGAQGGPEAFRTMLKKTGPTIDPRTGTDISRLRITDAGDATSNDGTLESAHASLERMVRSVVEKGGIPFVIGGGNDQSFPNGRGFLQGRGEDMSRGFTVVNIDAHFDVRPLEDGKVHSGSPFRCLAECYEFKEAQGRLVEFAAQSWQCSAAHAEFIRGVGGEIRWFDDIHADPLSSFKDVVDTAQTHGDLFVSFDIDSIQSSDCPGVSCPAPTGLTAWDALRMCRIAGQTKCVRVVDMSEFNPAVESYRTSKLTAAMFYQFVLGVAERK
ncbi:Ureohydrolase [Carpediemonas membranifera]|uniref:Ureohydrolase n=1 Tax=Carpediemonas membranifera TaxID=201153 RepID=A0A8J6AUH6_9EUKA|nr:Ureohydrolase [Carpediemonas membranifera]|eukprot:KAG9392810.1 Ureohydrolase [Carpediemonas membranifera]